MNISNTQSLPENSAASWVDSIMKSCVDRANNPEIAEQYAALKSEFLTGAEGSVDKLSDLRKQLTGHVIPKSDRKSLDVQAYIMQNLQDETEPVIGRVPTDYYKNSQRMGNTTEKDGGYWDSEVEMTARAFACYVKDKLEHTLFLNDFDISDLLQKSPEEVTSRRRARRKKPPLWIS